MNVELAWDENWKERKTSSERMKTFTNLERNYRIQRWSGFIWELRFSFRLFALPSSLPTWDESWKLYKKNLNRRKILSLQSSSSPHSRCCEDGGPRELKAWSHPKVKPRAIVIPEPERLIHLSLRFARCNFRFIYYVVTCVSCTGEAKFMAAVRFEILRWQFSCYFSCSKLLSRLHATVQFLSLCHCSPPFGASHSHLILTTFPFGNCVMEINRTLLSE